MKEPRSIALAAVVGAAYAALTIGLAPISYGPVQFRISEVLCILPYFLPGTAWGLFIGCAVSNIIGGGVLDIVFGSLATLGAALVTAWLGKKEHTVGNSLLACLPPVVFNAVIVGAVVTAVFTVEGERYLCVVMNSSYDGRFTDTQKLYELCAAAQAAPAR